MDIWVLIHVSDDIVGELDNSDNPTKSDIRVICNYADMTDIVDYYDDRAIKVIPAE